MSTRSQSPRLLARSVTFLALVCGAEPALAQAHSPPTRNPRSTPTAFVIGLDTSGSMMRGERFETATHVASTTVEGLSLREDLRVVLVAASDSVSVIGTFVLASEADRSALLRAIHGMQPLRATHTSFSLIDEGIAATVRERLQPDEQLAVLLVTDGVSDDPVHDLAATNLGRHARDVGHGVLAVWSGPIPVEPTAATTRRPRALPPTRSDAGRAQLLELVEAPPARWVAPAQHLIASPSLIEGVSGERPAAELFPTLSNPASFARTYALEAAPVEGVSVSLPMPTVTVPANGSVRVPVRVAFDASRSETVLHLVARAPGERAATPTRIALTLETMSWWQRHARRLAAGTFALFGLFIAACLRARRSVTLANGQDPSSVVTLSPSTSVPLSQFAPSLALDAGSLERGVFGGFYVRANATSLTCNGVPVSSGGRARYALGSNLRVDNETLRVVQARGEAAHNFRPSVALAEREPALEY